MYVVHRTLGSHENSQDLVLLGWYYGGPYVLGGGGAGRNKSILHVALKCPN